MSYKVIYTDRVIAQVSKRIDELREDHAGEQDIAAWYKGLFDRIDNLYDMPRLYMVDEPYSKRVGYKVHKLSYKKYIVRYRVDDDTRTVRVMSFFHSSQRKEA